MKIGEIRLAEVSLPGKAAASLNVRTRRAGFVVNGRTTAQTAVF